ncbi:MAG: pyrimidine 5'-nucleotidase [Deltaproteobacteria bacterium]
MLSKSFSHVRFWVFDLDNTLYHPDARLFDQIEVKMTNWVMQALAVDHAEANYLRDHYWKTHGTTLAGLMREHGLEPGPYLDHVHDISLDHIETDLVLAARIRALPGVKIVYTNGPKDHAERVTAARGLSGVFDGLYGIGEAGFRPKPERAAFETIFAQAGVRADQAAMFEDDPKNLLAPYAMGMRTVLVHQPGDGEHIHHKTDDLTAFLEGVI